MNLRNIVWTLGFAYLFMAAILIAGLFFSAYFDVDKAAVFYVNRIGEANFEAILIAFMLPCGIATLWDMRNIMRREMKKV